MKRIIIILFLMMLVSIASADYTLQVEALTNSPADNVINYFGNKPSAPTTTADRNRVYFPIGGTITRIEIYDYSGTAGTAETYGYRIRINNANDYYIANLTVAASERIFTNTSMNIAVNAGDYFEIKRLHPAWATNPLTNIVGGYVWVTTSTPGYVLWGQGLTNSPADNVINYFGTKPGTPVTNAGRAKIYIPANGTITRVDVNDYSGTAGTAETYGYRFNKNGGAATFVQNLTAAANLRTFTNSSENTAVTTTDYIEFSRVHPAWATNPLTNIVGATAFVNMTGSSSSIGYPLYVQALTSSPTDAQTVYFGNLPKAPQTSGGWSKVYIRQSGIIKRAEVYTYSGTAGTAESWSLYVRKNNTEDFLIATVAAAASERRFTNATINIPVTAGDYLEIKGVQPTWSTNPLTTIYGGYLWITPVPPDITPPASITGLTANITYNSINWSWVNPSDSDFNGTTIYQNGIFLKNVSNTTTFDLWEGLVENTSYTFGAYTTDVTGNRNLSWVNSTQTTPFSGLNPVEVIIYTGDRPINYRLSGGPLATIYTDAEKSMIVADEMHNAMGQLTFPYNFTDGTINISIKRIDYNLSVAKWGVWINATRDGQEVLTRSPIWIINSPYEVVDSELPYNPVTNEKIITVREDPVAAAQQVLSGYVSRQPLGKAEGDDVLIVYLSEDTADEYIYEGTDAVWTTLRGDTGEGSGDGSGGTPRVATTTSATEPLYSILNRIGYGFNTSAVGVGSTVTNVITGVYVNSKENNIGSTGIGITDFSPSVVNNFQQTDYNNWVNTRYATDIEYASVSTVAYTNFTWWSNATQYINKNVSVNSGYTNFMLRLSADIDNSNSSIPWSSAKRSGYAVWDYTESAGKQPFLEITYTPAAGGSAPVSSFTVNRPIARIPQVLTFTNTSTNTPTLWNWSWGDGTWTNGTTQNPTHQYTKRGLFPVFLLSSNAYGSNTSASQNIRVVGYENLW